MHKNKHCEAQPSSYWIKSYNNKIFLLLKQIDENDIHAQVKQRKHFINGVSVLGNDL